MLTIRKTRADELDVVLGLFEQARTIMRADGNYKQWANGHPKPELVINDIRQGNSYLCEDEHGQVVATFAFIPGIDPTYIHIYEGQWIDADSPYGVIHRMASTPQSHGVARQVFDWCFARCHNLKVDTHRDNHIMQHLLAKMGFTYCGIIYLLSGDERLAFQKIEVPQACP